MLNLLAPAASLPVFLAVLCFAAALPAPRPSPLLAAMPEARAIGGGVEADELLEAQRQKGEHRGSRDGIEAQGVPAERAHATALGALTLEVSFRPAKLE